MASKLADSVIPLRLMIVTPTTSNTAIGTAKGYNDGTAETIASVPEDTLTATVSI
ncbi:conserved hypothetical protein [Listeria innocua FSL S4-378]|nr:conserved hypothetical protein [Listeria innocua FSL S4-378]